MRRFFLTYISLFLFACTMVWATHSEAALVSQRTPAAVHHETFAVKQGHSDDGLLQIEQIADAPTVAQHLQYANHLRTLRIFIAADSAGSPMLYLEQVKPRNFYVIHLPFALSPDNATFMWMTPTSFLLLAKESDGVVRTHRIDVHDLTFYSDRYVGDIPEPTPPVLID